MTEDAKDHDQSFTGECPTCGQVYHADPMTISAPTLSIERTSSADPVPTHGGPARAVYWRLLLNGVVIKEVSARFPWRIKVESMVDPYELTSIRDAIASALAAQCAPQPSGEPVAFLVDHYRPDFSIETEVAAEGDEGAYPVFRAVSCAAREAIAKLVWARVHTTVDVMNGQGFTKYLTLADSILSLPAAGGEASKREAEIIERCAKVVDEAARELKAAAYIAPDTLAELSRRIRALASIPDERGGVS